MPVHARIKIVLARRALIIAALAALVFQAARGQSDNPKPGASAKTTTAGAAHDATTPSAPEIPKTLKAAAEAVGLARWSGVGGQRLPEVDVINTMEIWGSGTTYGLGQPYKAGDPWPAFKTEYHAAIGYNPPAMRLEMTRTPVQGGGTPQHTIQ